MLSFGTRISSRYSPILRSRRVFSIQRLPIRKLIGATKNKGTRVETLPTNKMLPPLAKAKEKSPPEKTRLLSTRPSRHLSKVRFSPPKALIFHEVGLNHSCWNFVILQGHLFLFTSWIRVTAALAIKALVREGKLSFQNGSPFAHPYSFSSLFRYSRIASTTR